VEIPLKAIVRGYSWTVVPITWRNRRFGQAKLKNQGDGQPLFFHLRVCCGWKNISALPCPSARFWTMTLIDPSGGQDGEKSFQHLPPSSTRS